MKEGSDMKCFISIIISLLILFGCAANKETKIPADKFTVSLISKIDEQDIFLKHFKIEACGSHSITIKIEKGNEYSAVIDPKAGNKNMKADIFFIGTLSSIDENNSSLKCLVRIEGSGVTSGGSSTFNIPDMKNLKDIVKIELSPGEHLLGKEISIGNLKEAKILLTVK